MARLLRQRATIAEQASQTELDLKANLASPALTGTPTGIVRGSLAADIIDGTKLADDAVESEHYANASIDSDHIAASVIGVKPHIIPDVLYPSYVASGTSNKLLDGTTSHSGAFGTAQSDGRSYYYTNIAGSKPIKDPRIGAHFGSQRHMFKSFQLLEQETATHGLNVYSLDGRDWCRAIGTVTETNNDHGHRINITASDVDFFEIVGYFNDANFVAQSGTANSFSLYLNGGTAESNTGLTASVGTPLGERYVDANSVINLVFDTTPVLGINTIKILKIGGNNVYAHGIELIAHGLFTDATCDYDDDPTIAHNANTKMVAGMSVTGTGIPTGATIASVTSTTAFELSASTTGGAVTNGTLTFGVADIIIPAQNVVSYGKKFAISEVAHHYDPFNGFVNDTTEFSARVDMATSLGLGTATTWGAAWDKGSSNHIRPYNGGRVVKWVDSSGTIKTSVNMMPANAQNILGTVVGTTEVTTPSATNATYTPIFSDDAIDHSLAEVAKTFHWREFGNGSANQGHGGSYQDCTMTDGADAQDMAYVMDDGLTSVSGDDMRESTQDFVAFGNGDGFYVTFIGTGITLMTSANAAGTYHIVQNLPYGTHILSCFRDADGTPDYTIDGIAINDVAGTTYASFREITFHQPKMPPIPEDAVVLADYMLMADFVVQTADGVDKISKGVRYVSPSRDIFYDGAVAWTSTAIHTGRRSGLTTEYPTSGGHADCVTKIPSFATQIVHCAYNVAARYQTFNVNGSGGTIANRYGSSHGAVEVSSASTLGNNIWSVEGTSQTSYIGDEGWQLASPIHTSSHYQTFETLFLHELVGGDRNMEQTNLVVTPDGKTWDEVTRDVSYIGKLMVSGNPEGVGTGNANDDDYYWIIDDWRGVSGSKNCFNKDFAIAYDRMICLKSGQYRIEAKAYNSGGGETCRIYVNGIEISFGIQPTGDDVHYNMVNETLKRGDFVQIRGQIYTSGSYLTASIVNITRI